MATMKVDIRVGDTLGFSGKGKVKVTVAAKSGQSARLNISADESVNIELPKREYIREVVKNGVNHPSR